MKKVRFEFNHGINAIADRKQLPTGECVISDNTDIRNGVMRPMHMPKMVDRDVPVGTRKIFEYRGKWYFSPKDRTYSSQFLGTREEIYVTERGGGHSLPFKIIDGKYALLGTRRPEGKLDIVSKDPIVPTELSAEFVEGEGGLAGGGYSYSVAIITDGGIQSPSTSVVVSIPTGKTGGIHVRWTPNKYASKGYAIYGRTPNNEGLLTKIKSSSDFWDNGAYNSSEAPSSREFLDLTYFTTWIRNVNGLIDESGPSLMAGPFNSSLVRVIKRPEIPTLGSPASETIDDSTYITHWRLYRSGDVPGWNLVTEQKIDVVEFVDLIGTGKLQGPPASVYVENYKDIIFDIPPSDLHDTVIHYNMLFGISQNTVMWTPVGQYDAWPRAFMLNFTYIPYKIIPFAGYLVVLCPDSLYLINGFEPSSLTLSGTMVKDGCIAPKSVQIVNNRLIYLARRGLMEFDGIRAECITETRVDGGFFMAPSKLKNPIMAWLFPTQTTYNYAKLANRDQAWIGAGVGTGNESVFNVNNESLDGPILNIESFVKDGKYFLYWKD